MQNYQISTLDYLTIFIYICGIFLLAYKSGKKTNQVPDEDSQYLASKSLTIPESLFSIIATEVSALTFLGIPAISYASDYSFLHIYFGGIIARTFIAFAIIPKIYGKGLTIYSVMGKYGTKSGQRWTAIFYSINKLLAVGVRLFSGSILIAAFFNLNIYLAISIICAITFFYTLIGGLKAVVRTDMTQMALFVGGGICAHYIISSQSSFSWTQLITSAVDAGKINIIDFNNLKPFFIGIVGGTLFDMATHGVDQDFAQRLTANKSQKGAQKAIMISSIFSIIVALIFLGVGSLLWSHYQTITPPSVSNDQLFSYFITQFFPAGLKGLMVAGVLAATMSTLDSSINAMSATLYKDILNKNKKLNIESSYKKDTLIITLLLMLVAFISSKSSGLVLLGLKIPSWTAGSLLALFFTTLSFRKFFNAKLDSLSVIGAYAIGIFSVWINSYFINGPWQFNVYYGFISSLVFLYIKGQIYSRLNLL
ncbi:MAG: hypothetical protein N4A33_11305 [Bacteriovoracaceae bacterium]|nr:hypothetical protein [Bacteriovoracaceae bacterium]